MNTGELPPALQEPLLPREGDGDQEGAHEGSIPEGDIEENAQFDAQENIERGRRYYAWLIFHLFRRFLVGGIKVSGTVAFAMYLHLIFKRVSFYEEESAEHSALIVDHNFEDSTLYSFPTQAVFLACSVGELNFLRVFYDMSEGGDGYSPNQLDLLTNITQMVYDKVDTIGLKAAVPAACIDVGVQAVISGDRVASIILRIFSSFFTCNYPAQLPPDQVNQCYNCLPPMPEGINASECVPYNTERELPASAPATITFLSLRSAIFDAVMKSVTAVNQSGGDADAMRLAAARALNNVVESRYDEFTDYLLLTAPSSPFLSLSSAYRHMGNVLISVFIVFGALDALMMLFLKLGKQIRPVWYGLVQGVDAGLIKVLLLLTLFGHCQYPGRPTHAEFESGEKITFMNIPTCSADIDVITYGSLTWLIPLSTVVAYFEFNKFNLNRVIPTSRYVCLNRLFSFLRRRQSLLSILGLAISTFTGFLALMDLLFNHLIPYGSAVKNTPGVDLSNRDDMIVKLTLAIPVMMIGGYVEKRYLHSREKGLPLRKILSTLIEWCKLILFNYIALSFFVSFEYVNSQNNYLNDNEAEKYSGSIALTAWDAYWLLLCLSLVGSLIVVLDEWFYKMQPEATAAEKSDVEDTELGAMSGGASVVNGAGMFRVGDGNDSDAECLVLDAESRTSVSPTISETGC